MLRFALAAALSLTAMQAAAQTPPPAAPGGGPPPEVRERMRHFREVCQADSDRLCASAGEDRRARRQCLVANQDKLSKDCQAAMAQMEAWRRDHPRPQGGGARPD